MKRYLVFAYEQYYPGGGSSDVEFECDNLQEIRDYKPKTSFDFRKKDYIDILDLQERRWLEEEEFSIYLKH